ncbi:hypothetical protein FQN54_007941 [Arachnomyces sp. PD_36]|nr:hypothetical protein FQN54_007941 [Arachnomyces sp. PD_36]
MAQQNSSKQHVVVIGAGVVGLQTSLFLLEEGYRVTTLAQFFPGDHDTTYTSPMAGGQWRSHAAPGQEQCDWDLETYKYWSDIIDEEDKHPEIPFEEKSGLGRYPSHTYWNSLSSPDLLHLKDNSPQNLWWTSHVPNFAPLSPTSFPSTSPPIKLGVAYTSFTFNPEKHIKYLLNRVLGAGGRTIRATLPTKEGGIIGALEEARRLAAAAEEEDPVFINATGLGARTFVPDDAMQPIRGQTIIVKGEAERISTHLLFSDTTDSADSDERIAYVVPRKGTGTTIIGGTKQVGNWDTEPDEGVSRDILGWARGLAPELVRGGGELEVLKVQVGLRPGRKGGARVESEVLGGAKGMRVVHAYGHAGAGFQNSVGCARKVVRLVKMLVK